MSFAIPFTDEVTKEIGNTQYNLDKSLESLVESRIAKGVSSSICHCSSNKWVIFEQHFSNMQKTN
jgi:hypothetical protein